MTRASIALLLRETAWAVRRLWRSPRFVALAVLTIGTATAPSLLFSLVGRAVLPTLPFDDPDTLVSVWRDGTTGGAYPPLTYLREHSKTLDVAVTNMGRMTLDQSASSITLPSRAVTANYFDVFRLRPLLGRAFTSEDNLQAFGHPVVILSEPVWRSRFNAREDVIGESVRLNGEVYVVVGVMPAIKEIMRGYDFETKIFIPAMMAPRALGRPGDPWRTTAGAIESSSTNIWKGSARLRPGRTLTEARAEMEVLSREAKSIWPKGSGRSLFDLTPVREEALKPQVVQAVSLLRVAGALVLLLGGINLGTLFMTRGLKRSTAMALHSILGAPRAAIVWGVIAECLIVGLLGSIVAAAFAKGALIALALAEPSILTAPFGVTFNPSAWREDASLLRLSLTLATLTSVACGVATTWRTTGDVSAKVWKSGSGILAGGLRGMGPSRPTGMLIAAEVAFALAATLPALLLVRSLSKLVQEDLGFQARNVAVAPLTPPETMDEESILARIDAIIDGVKETGAADRAAWVSCVPIDCANYTMQLSSLGPSRSQIVAAPVVVSNDAFATLGIPIVQGRAFNAGDRRGGVPVAVISRRAADLLGGSVVGTRLRGSSNDAVEIEIVGVVGDVPYHDLASDPLPVVYFPLAQSARSGGVLVARVTASFPDGASAMSRAVKSVDPRLPGLTVTSLEARVKDDLARFRGATWLLSAGASLAFLLAGIGMYGLISSVIQRALPEIGVRMAFGAPPKRMGRDVAGATLRLVAIGLAVGGVLGAWGARSLQPYLFGVTARDGSTLILMMLASCILAAVGAFVPAYRASRVDPMIVLRNE